MIGRRGGVLDKAKAQAFFGKRAGDEPIIAFAILAAAAARARIGQKVRHLIADLPSVVGMRGEHRADDVEHALLAKQPALAILGKLPQLGDNGQSVAAQAVRSCLYTTVRRD